MAVRETGFEPRAFRRRRNRMLGTASEAAAPLLRKASRLLARGVRTEPSAWRTGLILGHNHIGDVLYRTCSLPFLRLALPNCRWTYLGSSQSAEVLRNNPHIGEVLPWNTGDDSWGLDRTRFSELRSRGFDAVLCTNTVRHFPDFFLASALGIPNRVGFTHKGLTGLINHPVSLDFPSSYAGYFRTMVAAVAGLSPDWPLRAQVFMDAADRTEANTALLTAGFRSGVPLIACAITTRQQHGNWPAPVLLAILRQARQQIDFDVALCGAASDFDALRAAASELGSPAKVLAGKVSIRGFAALLEHCAALLTVDSGPRHIGNAVGLPVVFARNLSHSLVEAGKYCETETDLAPAVEYLSDSQVAAVARNLPVRDAATLFAERILSGARRA